MGPGIAAEPHCAEREIAGVRFLPTLHPEGKASAVHDPCALAQASRRSRSAARSPGLFPAAFALVRPCGLSVASTRLCRRFPDRSALVRGPLLPSPFGSDGPGPRLRFEFAALRRVPRFPSLGSGPGPASLAIPGKPVPAQVATNRPFAALLGTIVLRAALTAPRKGDPACGGETIISSGASCRLRFEDPPVRSVRASWGSPTVAKPNSNSSPCRRRSEVPSLSCRLTLAGLLEERAGCPPIT